MNKLPTKSVKQVDHVFAGRTIRQTRELRGISLRELARQMGISAPFLSDLELGRRNWLQKHYTKALKILSK